MKRTLLRFVAISLCVCAIVIVTGQVSFAADDKDAKALAVLDSEWSKAAATGNVDKIVSYYAADATAYPPNEPAVKGTAALKKAWTQQLADPKTKLSWKNVTSSTDGNLGFTSGTYEVTSSGKVVEKGKYLCVWRKESDGKWKATNDMWNSDSK